MEFSSPCSLPIPVRAIFGRLPYWPLSSPCAISIKVEAITFSILLAIFYTSLFCHQSFSEFFHSFCDQAFYFFFRYSRFCAVSFICLDYKRYTIEQVCHTSKEETSFSDDHCFLDLSFQNIFTCKSDVRNT